MVDCDVVYIFGIVYEGYACRHDETVNDPFVCQFTDSLQESTSFPKVGGDEVLRHSTQPRCGIEPGYRIW